MQYDHLICQNVSRHGSHFRPELGQLGAFWTEYSRCIIVTKPKVITSQFFALCQNIFHRNGFEAKVLDCRPDAGQVDLWSGDERNALHLERSTFPHSPRRGV